MKQYDIIDSTCNVNNLVFLLFCRIQLHIHLDYSLKNGRSNDQSPMLYVIFDIKLMYFHYHLHNGQRVKPIFNQHTQPTRDVDLLMV